MPNSLRLYNFTFYSIAAPVGHGTDAAESVVRRGTIVAPDVHQRQLLWEPPE